jgi:hypothetical protein
VIFCSPEYDFSIPGGLKNILEERELGMELAFDEDSLATVDLDSRQEIPTRVGVNAKEMSYLVWSPKRRNDNTDGRSECKRE